MGDFAGAILPRRKSRNFRETDTRYSEHKICPHPDCEAWIGDDAESCRHHREWYCAVSRGDDEESRLEKHRQILELIAGGMTAVEAVAERNRTE